MSYFPSRYVGEDGMDIHKVMYVLLTGVAALIIAGVNEVYLG